MANVEGTFAWKNGDVKPTLENEGYAVVFSPTDTANYKNSEEMVVPIKVLDMVYVAVHAGATTIDSTLILKGSSYALPNAPDSVGYDFAGFYQGESLVGNAGDKITVGENTVIDAVYKIKTFVVTFMNGSTVLQSGEVSYGVIPTAPKVTLPENTAQYTYSFGGWDKEIVAVTEAATYNAVIDSVVNKYVITFMDGETELQSGEVAYGVVPTAPAVTLPKNTAKYTYSFIGWDKEVVAVTGVATYTAVIDSALNKYDVVFKDYDGTVLKNAVEYYFGTLAKDVATPNDPTRGATAQYIYSFKGWNPAVTEVTEDAEYIAEYDSTVRSYTITFMNGTEKLQSSEIEYGVMPSYKGETPTRAANVQYSYTFKGWSPSITTVTGAKTYTAVFDSVVNKYVITFMDGETELQSGEVEYGVVPTAPAVTLPKNTAMYTYSFIGWDKDIVAVTGAATYTAVIDSALNSYDVVFKDYDGTVLKSAVEYDYGTSAKDVAAPANPTRNATAKYTYSFKGWNPAITEVTEDAEYVAEYDSTIRSYTIAFMNGTDELQSGEVEYGVTPSYKGETPARAANAQYTYTFKGWTPTITSVTRSATYTAVFDSTTVKYTVVFKNGDMTLQTSSVAYGVKPVYSGVTPAKEETDSCTYKFSGWNSKIQPVSGDVTYSAQFEMIKKTFIVRFKNGNNVLKVISVAYGETPEYTGNTPTKKSTSSYSYEFIGWSPKIGPITKETNYVALYDSTSLVGIDSRLANLEMSVDAFARTIQIAAAPVGSTYALLDLQGRVLQKGRVESANFNIAVSQSGGYLVRINKQTTRVNVK